MEEVFFQQVPHLGLTWVNKVLVLDHFANLRVVLLEELSQALQAIHLHMLLGKLNQFGLRRDILDTLTRHEGLVGPEESLVVILEERPVYLLLLLEILQLAFDFLFTEEVLLVTRAARVFVVV